MYLGHRKRTRSDSTDWAIYSTDVPVFRTDDGTELEQPWLLSFITCAVPYAPAIGKQEAYTGDLPNLPEPSVLISDSDLYESSGKYLMGSINGRDGGWVSGNYWKFIMDRKGRIVWASLTPQGHWSIYLQPSYDGTSILWDQNTYWADWDGGNGSQIHQYSLLLFWINWRPRRLAPPKNIEPCTNTIRWAELQSY